MLILVTFFLLSLVISTIAIWFYRFISNWEGFNQLTVSDAAKNTKRWFRVRKGFDPSASSVRGRAKSIALTNARCGIKTPWGW